MLCGAAQPSAQRASASADRWSGRSACQCNSLASFALSLLCLHGARARDCAVVTLAALASRLDLLRTTYAGPSASYAPSATAVMAVSWLCGALALLVGPNWDLELAWSRTEFPRSLIREHSMSCGLFGGVADGPLGGQACRARLCASHLGLSSARICTAGSLRTAWPKSPCYVHNKFNAALSA